MSDRDELVQIANDREIWRNLTDRFPHPYTAADAEEWLAACEAEEEPTRSFAVEVDGRLAGGAGVKVRGSQRSGSAEIGYWLGRLFWGRGVATAITQALSAYAFETFDLERVEANVFGWNPASAWVLEKAGFQLEGCLRRAVIRDGERTDLL